MKHLNKYGDFITEKYGLNDDVKKYADFLTDFAFEKLMKWSDNPLVRSQKVYDIVKDLPSGETLKVNKIKLKLYFSTAEKFGVNVSGCFFFIDSENHTYGASHINDEGELEISMKLTVFVPKSETSFELDKMRQDILDLMKHELTHALVDFKKKSNRPIVPDQDSDQAFAKIVLHSYKNNFDTYFAVFLYSIYRLNKHEINSSIAELDSLTIDKDITHKYEKEIFNSTPEEIYQKIITGVKRKNGKYKYDPIDRKSFESKGRLLYKHYNKYIKHYHINPDRKITKMKNMNGLELVTYLYNMFKPEYEKYIRKANKVFLR